MDNQQTDEAAALKKENLMRTLRIVWSVLIAVFVAIILFRLYSWSQGKGDLHEILSPLGMIFVGLSNIFSSRNNKTLTGVLVAIALVLVVSGLVTTIMY